MDKKFMGRNEALEKVFDTVANQYENTGPKSRGAQERTKKNRKIYVQHAVWWNRCFLSTHDTNDSLFCLKTRSQEK